MGRSKGPDENKILKIKSVLRKYPQGLWIREIARQAKMSKSTAHRYLTYYMKNQIEEAKNVNGLVKFVKLK